MKSRKKDGLKLRVKKSFFISYMQNGERDCVAAAAILKGGKLTRMLNDYT